MTYYSAHFLGVMEPQVGVNVIMLEDPVKQKSANWGDDSASLTFHQMTLGLVPGALPTDMAPHSSQCFS